MGNTASPSSRLLTVEEQDLKSFGDRYAFSDEELRHIYRAYNTISSVKSVSFLVSWGTACCAIPESDEQLFQTERMYREQQLRKIDSLLADFGNRLYCKVLLPPEDRSMYSSLNQRSAQNKQEIDSEVSSRAIHSANDDEVKLRRRRLEYFFDGLALCSRKGSNATLAALVRVLEEPDAPGWIDAHALLALGYHLALATAILRREIKEIPRDDYLSTLFAFAELLMQRAKTNNRRDIGMTFSESGGTTAVPANEKLVNLRDVQEWVDVTCPVFASILPSFLWELLFSHRPYPPSSTAFQFPRCVVTPLNASISSYKSTTSSLNGENLDSLSMRPEDSGDYLLNAAWRYVLACCSPHLNGPFIPLFNSETDGLSFNRLQNALLGYSGPTLLVITTGTSVFGSFTSSKWKEAKDYYGSSDTFLFMLSPKIRIYRPSERNSSPNYQYCNPSARSKGYDHQAHGIGFGGSVQRPRLFLNESFEDCIADKQDLTFDNGPLLLVIAEDGKTLIHRSSFSPDSVQVWAVGGEQIVTEALQARGAHRDHVEAGIRKARKVDKAAFLDDLRSGVIENKAFVHRQQVDGRADFSEMDRK